MKKFTVILAVALMGFFPSAALAKKHHHKKHHHHKPVPVYVAPKPPAPKPQPAPTPPPAPSPQGPLSLSAAGSAALNFAQSSWPSQLPSYSAAYSLPIVSSNYCLNFGTYTAHCVVSIDNSDYYFDPILDYMDGYAYCVGTVYVTENQWSGSLSTTDAPGTLSCDSTFDY
jgi:hypothetical protein